MATITAEASLTITSQMDAIIGFIPWRQGFIDPETGYIRADSFGRWNAVSSWDNFTSYNQGYKQIRWTSNQVDLGEVKDFTMKIETEYNGDLFFIIHTSETGLFQGEETEVIVENGNYAVDSFYARYVYVTAIVNGNELRKMQITTSSQQSEFRLFNLDTTTLGGTTAARVIDLEYPLSAVKEVIITPQAPAAYAVDLYASSTATSRVLIPLVYSKGFVSGYFVDGYIEDGFYEGGSQITFALVGIDNQPRDSLVDVSLRGLPKQAMIGGNLLTIA